MVCFRDDSDYQNAPTWMSWAENCGDREHSGLRTQTRSYR